MMITNSAQNKYSLADNYEYGNGYVQQIRHNQTEGITSSWNEQRPSL